MPITTAAALATAGSIHLALATPASSAHAMTSAVLAALQDAARDSSRRSTHLEPTRGTSDALDAIARVRSLHEFTDVIAPIVVPTTDDVLARVSMPTSTPTRTPAPSAASSTVESCGCVTSAATASIGTGQIFWLPEAVRHAPVTFDVVVSGARSTILCAHGQTQQEIIDAINAESATSFVHAYVSPENPDLVTIESVLCGANQTTSSLEVTQVEAGGVVHQPHLFYDAPLDLPMRATRTGFSVNVRSDLNCDGGWGFDDLLVILAEWGRTDSDADVNGDGIVDLADIEYIVDRWGDYQPPDLFVDASAPPGGDGLSWDTAYHFLQDALDVVHYDYPYHNCTVRVAGGVYYINDRSVFQPGIALPFLFRVHEGFTLLGGFAGRDAADPWERDLERFESVLSADLKHDDTPDGGNRDDNAYGVVVMRDGVMDGFTVTGARSGQFSLRALSTQWYSGSMISRIRFTDNQGTNGAVVWARSDRNERDRIVDCTFEDNVGQLVSARDGVLIERCAFIDNAIDPERPMLEFGTTSNDVPTLISNALFARNATPDGALISGPDVTVSNCTIVGHDGAVLFAGDAIDVANTIVSDVTAELTDGSVPSFVVRYCLLPFAWPGAGNLVGDPQFVDGAGGDFRLSDASPGLDAGDSAVLPVIRVRDLGGAPRVVDHPDAEDTGIPRDTAAIVDIGAYESEPNG